MVAEVPTLVQIKWSLGVFTALSLDIYYWIVNFMKLNETKF